MRKKMEPHMHPSIVSREGHVPLLNRCCSLEIIATIKGNLHKKNLKAFEDSCFGHLLEMNPLCFQGPLLLHLLLHIDRAASKNNNLIFNINNSIVEFKPHHFQSITGLRLGTFEAATTATSSRLHKDVFGGKASIAFKDIEKAFLKACRDHRGGGEVSLKLALLYFLCGVVLPRGRHRRRKIDMWYVHLADNLPLFRSFPWGRAGYELLVSSMMSVRLLLDGSRATRIEMPGFTFALQVWAYENMPSLALYCAKRVRNLESSTVGILNWSADKTFRFDQLKQYFTPGVGVGVGAGGDDEVRNFSFQALSGEASPGLQNVKVEPLASTSTHTSIPPEQRRRAYSEYAAEVEDEEAEKEATPAKHSRLRPNPISTSQLQSSSTETERIKSIVALAFENNSAALDTPQPLSKTFDFDISKGEYERIKVLYEALLYRTNRLKLWISYAKFEAFALIQGSQTRDKRKRLEGGRGVFERGDSYFRSRAPKMKEERRMLLEAWFDMEYRFGDVGDVGSVRAKLPQKVKKTRLVRTMDGSARDEEYADYIFP